MLTGLLVLSVACWSKPMTEAEARRAAQQVFMKECTDFHYDPNSFIGPTQIQAGGADFAYEWRYKAVGNNFTILIGVNRHGVEQTHIGEPPKPRGR